MWGLWGAAVMPWEPSLPRLTLLGQEQSRFLPADPTTFTIEGLRAGTVYAIGVSAIVDGREGPPVTTTGRTGEAAPCLLVPAVPFALGTGDSDLPLVTQRPSRWGR